MKFSFHAEAQRDQTMGFGASGDWIDAVQGKAEIYFAVGKG